MPRERILPLHRPSVEDRQLCAGVEWPEVAEILSKTNLKEKKMPRVRAVFDSLHAGEGIQYIGKTPKPTEPKLEFRVGEVIDMTADFHSMVTEVNKVLFISNRKRGMDFVRYPNVTRDYMRGWTADDPLKRLGYAQAMIIAKRKQVEPNVDVAPDASGDDADSTSDEEESYDPGTEEDNQSSSETASMPTREAVDVVAEQVARGTPTETSSVSSSARATTWPPERRRWVSGVPSGNATRRSRQQKKP